jgi:hypothetical protein
VNLSSIDTDVNAALESQAPTPKQNNGTAAQVLAPVETAAEQELARLRKENAELRQQQLDADRDKRIKAVVAASNVQDSLPTNGEMAVRRQRAISQCPNKTSQWYKTPLGDRVNALTDGNYIPVKDTELAKYFGPKSDAAEATRLKISDPKRYLSYRATAVELGWIG